jgi:hypothetical protein
MLSIPARTFAAVFQSMDAACQPLALMAVAQVSAREDVDGAFEIVSVKVSGEEHVRVLHRLLGPNTSPDCCPRACCCGVP